MSEEMPREALTQLLRWYADMGVDLAVDDMPHDRFAESQSPEKAAPPAVNPPRAVAQPARVAAPAPVRITAPPLRTEDLVLEAARAETLEDLRAQLLAFEGCGLKGTATQLVFLRRQSRSRHHAGRRGAGRR